MTHSDDNGLVLPPAIVPTQIMILPISNEHQQLQAVQKLQTELQEYRVKLTNQIKVLVFELQMLK
nr:hypothetical protein [Spiroplasma endosymbiont of Phyllotreta cruciferae]